METERKAEEYKAAQSAREQHAASHQQDDYDGQKALYGLLYPGDDTETITAC